MNTTFQKVIGALTGRVAANIYFWAFVILPRIDYNAPAFIHVYANVMYAMLIILVYVNNLYLTERFLARKKYGAYLLWIFLIGFIITFCYTYTLKHFVHHHPTLNIHTVSIFVSQYPTSDLSFQSVLSQMMGYYAIFMTVVFVFTMGWYRIVYFRQQRQHTELQKKQLETELQFLKGQINPHFLFNTLNNLYGLSLEPGVQASEAILKLSAILRYFLYESNVERISFEKEKEVMLAYIDLELLRLHQKENMRFTISSDGYYDIPPLLWLPVLENTFKHGTRYIGNDPEIDFKCTVEDNRLIIYSKNKFSPKAVDKSKDHAEGIGLNNLVQRLEIYFPKRHTISSKQEGNYYIVNVEIILDKNT